MKFCLREVKEEYRSGFREILMEQGQEVVDFGGIPVILKEYREPRMTVDWQDGVLILGGSRQVHYYRALSHFLQKGEKAGGMEETPIFADIAVMQDCSGNGVPKLSELKSEIRMLASMGVTELFLYMEDVYTVEEQPYFGAFRGRYTEEELREADAYGACLGVELIPCIQTLSRLGTFLQWEQSRVLCDEDGILLTEDARVQQFLSQLIFSVSRCFRTKKIHLGMDMPSQLGKSRFLGSYGYETAYEFMKAHLDKVCALCMEMNLEPMIWGDMYTRTMDADGKRGGQPAEQTHSAAMGTVTEQTLAEPVRVPENLRLVFRDYECSDEASLKQCLAFQKKLTARVSFATGGSSWNGISPNYAKMLAAMEPGLKAAGEQRADRVICVFRQDDGAETPMQTSVFSKIYFAQLCYGGSVTDDGLSGWLAMYSGFRAAAYRLLDGFDHTPGTLPNNEASDNPSKYLLYQDVLLGLFDRQIEGLGLTQYYEELAKKLSGAIYQASFGKKVMPVEKGRPGYRRYAADILFRYYQNLAVILAEKAELGIRAYQAYHAGNKKELSVICNTLKSLKERCTLLKEQRESLWFMEYKPFGYEVLDIRLGGLATRLESSAKRMEGYLLGKWEALPELSQRRLAYREVEEDGSRKLASCNLWERIVTAGKISGA